MSDHDLTPDPMDEAYVEAEAVLSDDKARAARRARVLTSVEGAAAASPPVASPANLRRTSWRRGGWLAVASVVGLGVVIATQVYQPFVRWPRAAPSLPSAPAPAVRGADAQPGSPAFATAPAPRAVVAPSRAAAPVPAAPVRDIAPSAPAPQAFPAAPPPPPPAAAAASERTAPVAGAIAQERPASDARDEAAGAQGLTSETARAPATLTARAAAPMNRLQSSAAPLSEQAARLRAAAAAGRTGEVEALLNRGVPIDAADLDGNTALMLSIKADQPATAALLRRHGARLDQQNRAGETARDMATAKGDAELNRAIGVGP
jgi:hypothetical protein